MSTPTFRCPNCDENFLSPAQSEKSRVFCPHCSHSESADNFVLLSGEVEKAEESGTRVQLPTKRSEGIRKYKESNVVNEPVDTSALSTAELKVLAALGMTTPDTLSPPKEEERASVPAKLDRSGQVKDAILDRSELIPIRESESVELPPRTKSPAAAPAEETAPDEPGTSFRAKKPPASPDEQASETLEPVIKAPPRSPSVPEALKPEQQLSDLQAQTEETPLETTPSSTRLPETNAVKSDKPAEKVELKQRPIAEDIDIIVQGARSLEDDQIFESWNDARTSRHSQFERKFTVGIATVTLVSLAVLMCLHIF